MKHIKNDHFTQFIYLYTIYIINIYIYVFTIFVLKTKKMHELLSFLHIYMYIYCS